MQKRIQLLVIGLGGIFLIAAAIYWLLMPRVMSTTPFDAEANVLSNTRIEVEFSQPIKTILGLDYLLFQPQTSGKYSIQGKTLTFIPDIPFSPDSTIQVSVNSKVRSTQGIPVLDPPSWSFQIKHPWLLYLLDTVGRVELYQIDPEGLDATRLVDTNLSIIDYSVSSTWNLVLYTAESGTDTIIEYYDLATGENTILYTCKQTICSQPLLSPDQKYLTFTTNSSPQYLNPSASQVMLLSLNNLTVFGNPIPVAGNDHPTHDASWSSTGWIVYYDETDKTYGYFHPSTGKRVSYPHDTGEVGTWSPDGEMYVFPKIIYPANTVNAPAAYSSQLVGFNPETGTDEYITRNETAEDVQPVYSPNGKWIVFARKYLTSSQWTPGRQIWIIRSDGNNSNALTNSADNNHLGFSWSPDGKYIAYLRFNTASYNQSREVWLMDSKTGITQKILVNGYRLGWLP
jgi:Tol biopolymer transport system component